VIRGNLSSFYFLRKFHKRSHLFICANNETLSVVAMRVSHPDHSPVAVHG
jgi:hypothetical protein